MNVPDGPDRLQQILNRLSEINAEIMSPYCSIWVLDDLAQERRELLAQLSKVHPAGHA